MRIVDLCIASFGLVFLFPVFILVAVICKLVVGQTLIFQTRVGKYGGTFRLIKFCTLKGGEPYVPTHELDHTRFTNTAKLLRKLKLDELPQLLNVLAGSMSIVGPRPSLATQEAVINERRKLGVLDIKPGITGLAQINGIDMSDPVKLAEWDAKMLEDLNLKNYFKYILLTVIGKGTGDRIRQ
jgi:lipopolysaccharide/colanic/teichoic acid biosynthesis glycosyltransferase